MATITAVTALATEDAQAPEGNQTGSINLWSNHAAAQALDNETWQAKQKRQQARRATAAGRAQHRRANPTAARKWVAVPAARGWGSAPKPRHKSQTFFISSATEPLRQARQGHINNLVNIAQTGSV